MSKYVFITGATAGFGKACAELFAKNGWNLIITGRRKDRLTELKIKIIEATNADVIALAFDVRHQSEVAQSINQLPNSISSNIEILINNAGLAVGKGLLTREN